MWNNFNNYNPMMMPGAPIRQIQEAQKTAQFFAVNGPLEMEAIRPDLNVIYIGMNKTKKEIYVKQLMLDGTTTSEVYNLASERKQDDLNMVLEKLANIEKRLNNEQNLTNADTAMDKQSVTKQSANGAI